MQSKTVNNEYSHDRQPWLAYIQSGPLHGGSAFDIKMIITKPETRTNGSETRWWSITAPAEFLRHKTTVRHHYHSEDDEFPVVLYYNENHRMTEFNIGNPVVEEAGCSIRRRSPGDCSAV